MPVENKYFPCLGNITILCKWMDRRGRRGPPAIFERFSCKQLWRCVLNYFDGPWPQLRRQWVGYLQELRNWEMANSFTISVHNDQMEFITSQEFRSLVRANFRIKGDSFRIGWWRRYPCACKRHHRRFRRIEISPSLHECCEGRQRW